MSGSETKGRGRRAAAATPMMTQYLRVRAEHPGAILLFRMGDFYETFFEDARVLARDTGVALTSRNAGDPDPIPLAGFPWHQAENYVAKLLRAGHRVAICDQVEEPGQGKKLLERRVTEVLSPGTALNDAVLSAGSNNWLAAVRLEGEVVGLAAADISTGECVLGEMSRDAVEEELARLAPSEILMVDSEAAELAQLVRGLEPAAFVTTLDPWLFGRDRGRQLLEEQYRVATLEPFEADRLGPALGAAGALLHYAREQKQSDLGHLRPPRRLRPDEGLMLDEATLRSLEILEPMPGGSTASTLLAVLDRTVTAAGARLLRGELRRPPADIAEISRRQSAVAVWQDGRARAELRGLLRSTADIERILGRLHCARATPRDLAALRESLAVTPRIASHLEACARLEGGDALPTLEGLQPSGLADRLARALDDAPPALVSDGGIFRVGWDPELDELKRLARDARGWIAELQERERRATGISGLKVGYNRVFGYYIEISQSQLARVPERYQRKQTLAGAERFLTPELKEFEEKVLHAEEEMARLERHLFDALCAEVREETARLQGLAAALARIDFLQGLSEAAAEGRWVRPLVDDEERITIRDGRHPVVERSLEAGRFVANDTDLDRDTRQTSVLTGPNMAGKSTYLRQVGLITVLAHLGSFVPAAEAAIGRRDRIFTRVGAQDALARGQSTFLVEMIETSRILHHATAHSLVLLDEVGRGTSTYDGLAIAWAVAEALESPAGARPLTIFATHFHELTRLARPERGFVNLNVVVREWGDRIIFVRRVEPGAADRSYGIHVAEMAGVPPPVIERARVILERLESEGRRIAPTPAVPSRPLSRTPAEGGASGPANSEGAVRRDDEPDSGAPGTGSALRPADADGGPTGVGERSSRAAQLHLFGPPEPAWIDELRQCDPDRLTPLAALELIARWKRSLEEEG